MRALSLTVGEWLLMLMNVSETLIGDLHEAAAARSAWWYWGEWTRAVAVALGGEARRHPLRAGWIGTMIVIATVGTVQVFVGISQPRVLRPIVISLAPSHVQLLKELPGQRAGIVP